MDFSFSSKKCIYESLSFIYLMDVFFEVVQNWHLLLFSACFRMLCPLLSEREYKCKRHNSIKAYKSKDRTLTCVIVFFLLHFPVFFRQTFQYSVFNKVPKFSISIPLHKYIMKDFTLIHARQKPMNIHRQRVNRKRKKIHDISSFI